MKAEWPYITGSRAANYVFNEVLGMATLEEYLKPSEFVLANVFSLFFAWVVVGSVIVYGGRWIGKTAYVTMGLPIFALFILFIRAVTLPSASSGISDYIGSWDWSVLVNKPDIWSTAVSQIFFSLGIAVSAFF